MIENDQDAGSATRDSIFSGRLALEQPAKGYRFAVDSVLLAWFAGRKPARRCLDLGCGCGVVGLGLLSSGGALNAVGVEIQARLARLATTNGRASFPDAYTLVEGDLRSDLRGLEGEFDLVVSNPPFWAVDTGRQPPDEERSIACHEIKATIEEVAMAARRRLNQRKGRFCCVFPARRLDDLLRGLEAAGLFAVEALFVHPTMDKPAEMLLVEARPGRGGKLRVIQPLFLKTRDGQDTPEAAWILEGRFISRGEPSEACGRGDGVQD